MLKIICRFERIIISVLLVLMIIAVLVTTAELGYVIIVEILKPPVFLLGINNITEIFGFFFMVLIGLELLETIKAYLEDNKLHVEIVFLVAMIAVARKIIIIDYSKATPEMLFAISSVIISLSIGYYFMKKGFFNIGNK
ncbi:MAG TPA: phosphate-starvation-inducible PsiE family protein [Victivallales bacterium]|nr:phosphate-starvation-inducible PsiE family protein [Victivallales bacterium]